MGPSVTLKWCPDSRRTDGITRSYTWTHRLGNSGLDNSPFPFFPFLLQMSSYTDKPPKYKIRGPLSLPPCLCHQMLQDLGPSRGEERRQAVRERAETRKKTGVAWVKPHVLLWLLPLLATTLPWGLFNGKHKPHTVGLICIVNCVACVWLK